MFANGLRFCATLPKNPGRDLAGIEIIEHQLRLPGQDGPTVLVVTVFERLLGSGDLLGHDAVNLLGIFAKPALPRVAMNVR